MNKTYFETMAEQALHEYDRVTPEHLKRQVILVMKEVDRDARHRAADIAVSASREILNMTP